jgi:hypothetical protein
VGTIAAVLGSPVSTGGEEGAGTTLTVFIAFYNEQRTHQGYRLKGRTPAQALREALGIERLPAFALPVDQHETEEETVPAQTD